MFTKRPMVSLCVLVVMQYLAANFLYLFMHPFSLYPPSLADAIIATWREKSSATFWKVLFQQAVLRNHIVGWKACFVIHRVFRDGHPNVRPLGIPDREVFVLRKGCQGVSNPFKRGIHAPPSTPAILGNGLLTAFPNAVV